jgi:hypothetical protein
VRAIEYFGRALSLAEEADDRETLASVLDELGLLHYRLDEDGPAISYSRRALVMYEANNKTDDIERLRARLDDLQGSDPMT